MPPLFDLMMVAPDREIYHGRAQGLVAPGVEGYFGVLAHHAPMIAALGTGEFKLVDDHARTHYFAVTGGFLEVSWEGVTVMADAAEAAEEIDVARARAAETRARQRLVAGDSDVDHARAAAALQRALNRLRVVGRVS
jgi:F-type H+-transporting ATPase subunit epsilon